MLSLVSVFHQDKRFKTLFTPSLVSVFEINVYNHYFFHPFPFITPPTSFRRVVRFYQKKSLRMKCNEERYTQNCVQITL